MLLRRLETASLSTKHFSTLPGLADPETGCCSLANIGTNKTHRASHVQLNITRAAVIKLDRSEACHIYCHPQNEVHVLASK